MTNIKNLAEFKRAIKVGTKIETTWHQWDGKKGENGLGLDEGGLVGCSILA